MPTEPRFANSQTSAHALGLACDTTHLYYASMADAPNACKSMWASIVGHNSKIYCSPWAPRNLVGKDNIKSIYQSLPGSSYTHLVAMTRDPDLLTVIDPKAAAITEEANRLALLDAHMPNLLNRFTALLNAHTDTPLLHTWAADLWDAALAEYAVMPLDAYGDCLAAWTIELTYDWTALVARLLKRAIITL